jgi:hypothetical protein
MVYLQTTYELCFGEAYFEYFDSCDFSLENTNIDVSVFMFDELEYEAWWRVSEANQSQTSYSVEQADIFQYQSYSHSDDMFIILRFNMEKNILKT